MAHYDEKSERDMLEGVQSNAPGAAERLSDRRKHEQEMREMDREFGFPPSKVDPQRDPKTVMRREIYDSIGNQNKSR